MTDDSRGLRRRTYLDFLRGIAVLLMIDAHLFDSWTRFPDRESRTFGVAMLLGGMGTTLFLVLAGIAVALSAGSKVRRTQDAGAASRAVMRRGLEIFALAFVFRFQAWILGWSHQPTDLLKVDILNIMGPSIVFAALLWRAGRTATQRFWLLAAAAALVAFITPEVRALLPPGVLPDALQAYLVPVAGLSIFVFFPWMALVFCGGAIGVLVDSALTRADESRMNMTLAAGGALLLAAAAAASSLPPLSSSSEFWTTSPSYLFMRAGITAIAVAACYAWTRLSGDGWSPVAQLGRTSLFTYWIHVEMVYGLISLPLHRQLSLPAAFAAYVVFCAFMLACSLLKDAAVARYRARQLQKIQAISAAPGPTR
jgi:uncharacterized membrane protein